MTEQKNRNNTKSHYAKK